MSGKGYCYFISYAHEYGFGNAQTTRDKPIRGIQDTRNISKEFERDFGVKEVVVLNFQLFD